MPRLTRWCRFTGQRRSGPPKCSARSPELHYRFPVVHSTFALAEVAPLLGRYRLEPASVPSGAGVELGVGSPSISGEKSPRCPPEGIAQSDQPEHSKSRDQIGYTRDGYRTSKQQRGESP